jgi:hypothetical protein
MTGGGSCGYLSTLESLLQNPNEIPKYKAAVKWMNGENSSLPFTSADLPQIIKTLCSPKCIWGKCYRGKCVCYDGYSGNDCSLYAKKYLECASSSTEYGVNIGGVSDWSTEVTFKDIQRRARKWIVQKIVYGNTWADWNQTDVQLRNDGYPSYLVKQQTVGTFLTRDLKAHYQNGKYVLLYDGDGKL